MTGSNVLAAVPLSALSLATTCPVPPELTFGVSPAAQYCAILPQNLNLHIAGCTMPVKNELIKLINQIRQSDPVLKQYFDFTLSYLEGFSIFVMSVADFTKTHPDTPVDVPAMFASSIKTLIIKAETIAKRSLNLEGVLRHEMRHAYWLAYHKYTHGISTGTVDCVFPETKAIQQTVDGMIKKGDARVDRLNKLLHQESGRQLDPKTLGKFNTLRKKVRKLADHYFYKRELIMDKATQRTYIIGKEYELGDLPQTLLGKVKVIGYTKSGIEVQILDPLRCLVLSVELTKRLIHAPGNFAKNKHRFEREAYLYQHIPVHLISIYYKELFAYTQDLSRQSMYFPHPRIDGKQPDFKTATELTIAEIRVIIVDNEAMANFVKYSSPKILFDTLQDVYNNPGMFKIGYDELRYALTNAIKHGVNSGEASLMWARLEALEHDQLNACRSYMRAFKQQAAFYFDDYLTCLEQLTAERHRGDAKIICQKALAKYRARYNRMPLHQPEVRQTFHDAYLAPLEEWRQEIASFRRGPGR